MKNEAAKPRQKKPYSGAPSPTVKPPQQNPSGAGGASAPVQPSSKKPSGISESDKKALFALLAVVALGAIAYAIYSGMSQDQPSDGSDFYLLLTDSQKVGLLYDARNIQSDAQQTAIYQCGVDMISRGRFAGKEVVNVGCENSGCIYTTTAQNGSSKMSFDEAQKTLYVGMPYILIKPGEGGYAFFKRHMEIYVPANVTAAASYCDISATQG